MKKILIAYFSHGGENLIENKIVDIGPEGNTSKVSKALKANLMSRYGIEADLFEIKEKDEYSFSYKETAVRAQQEKSLDARPAIIDGPVNFAEYDVIFLGYPNWWGTCPQPVLTFTSTHSFEGKTLVPFVTHGGQIFLYSIDDIKATLDGGRVIKGFAVSASYLDKAEDTVKSWLDKNQSIIG